MRIHISLDIWNTLFIPNPDFSAARNNILGNEFGFDKQESSKRFTKTKKEFDDNAVMYGTACTVQEAYRRLFCNFGVNGVVTESYITSSVFKFNTLFYRFPPTVLMETVAALKVLKDDNCNTFSIASNTNFISGSTIEDYLHLIDICSDFSLYSDIVGFSKPHQFFFKQIEFNAKKLHKSNTSELKIYHVGDSEACDIMGCDGTEIIGVHCPAPSDLPEIIKNIMGGKL